MNNDTTRLPTVGYFNKAILDALKIWGSDKADIELEVLPTEKQYSAALWRYFGAVDKAKSRSSKTKDFSTFVPDLKQVQKLRRSVQDIAQKYAKADFATDHNMTEFEPYIEEMIKTSFNDELICSWAILARKVLERQSIRFRHTTVKPCVN
jgi:Zn-dependent M32 family carboxypeptidase